MQHNLLYFSLSRISAALTFNDVTMLRRCMVWLITYALILSAAGCASIPQRTPLPEAFVNTAKPLDKSHFRIWGDVANPDTEKRLIANVVAKKHPSLIGKPHHYLAISGGGSNGAFGAGLLVGWSASGDRPNFTIVTGTSTGALTAPFAFLGSDYDDELQKVYTTISTSDILEKRHFLSKFFSDSAVDSSPLANLLELYIDEAMMKAIAVESEKGRGLYIGTTHLDAGRPVIWDIGAIAKSGHPDALNLIRQIMLASASIPAVFPPVLINVEAEGETYDELHVDGGVTAQVFFYPAGIDWGQLLKMYEVYGTSQVYIIRNAFLHPRWKQTDNKAIPIAARSLDTLIRKQGIGDLYRLYLLSKRDGLKFNLAYIPQDFTTPQNELFDQEYMQELFDLGYEMSKNGYPWSNAPPDMNVSKE